MTSKVWFITGASKGFGRIWAEAALERGDKVAATARDTAALKDLVSSYGENVLPLRLDVTDREADFAAVKRAHEQFGRLDVVINNAGYGLFGTIEEVSEGEARAQIETNLFGVTFESGLWLGLVIRRRHSGMLRAIPEIKVTIGGPSRDQVRILRLVSVK